MYGKIYAENLEKSWNAVVGKQKLCNKTILITGATGTIGAYLVDMLCWANENVNINIHIIAVSRKKETLYTLHGEENEYMTYLQQDVNKPFFIEESVDYIIHAAGNAYPQLFRIDSAGTILNSVYSTRNLLDLAREKQARVLYVSSGEVYGSGLEAGMSWMEIDCGKIDVSSWRSCYPIGKRTAENLCICYKEQFDLDIVIARPCHTFGANITKDDNRANAQFLMNAARGEEIVLHSSGLNRRSYLYVGDTVSALLTVLLVGQNGNFYNVAGDEVVSIKEFASICAKCGDVDVVFKMPNDEEKKEKTFMEHQILNNGEIIPISMSLFHIDDEAIRYYDSNMDKLEKMYSLLADERSRETVETFLNVLRSADVSLWDKVNGDSTVKLVDPEVFHYSEHEHFVDVGAFTGDTLFKFLEIGNGKYESIVAFEPDPKTFLPLENIFRQNK